MNLFNDEEKDERTAEYVNRGLEAMSDRTTLKRFLYIVLALNFLLWAAVILRPYDVRYAFERVSDVNNKISMIVLGIVFGLGMWITYSSLRLKFPDIEDQNLDSEVMATFAYQAHSSKRWFVWLIAVIGGVFNLLSMIFLDLFLTGS